MDNDTRLIFEAYEGSKQSIPDGTKVVFDLQNISPVEFGLKDRELDAELLNQYNGQTATVDNLETATELGQQDYEYYNITFENGFHLTGVSGYHLTPVPDKAPESQQSESTPTRRF